MLDGEEGSDLLLGIERVGVAEKSVGIVAVPRAPIRRGSLGYAGMLNDDIIYLDLDRFGDNAGSLLRTELLRLGRYDRQPDDVAGVILDLRGNSGGIIDEAVEVAAAFLPQGSVVVSTVGRIDEEKQIYKAQQGAVLPGGRVVVLVDSGSASAAEIVAAALQDYDAAVIMGAPTVGKGLVQTVYALPLDASLRLTTSWYVAPSGRSVQRSGLPVALVPDSLLAIHRTDGGRDMPGGAGVVPDTLLPVFANGALLPRLERSRIFGDYADTIAGGIREKSAEVVIDDETMAAFESAALMRLERIERERGALHLLDSLHHERGTGDERIEAAWSELARALTAADRAAFATHRSELARRLRHEVERRLLTRRERDAHRIAEDPGVIAAIALLRDERRYQKTITVKR
jgi:carboxyl-terminal processing protease